MKTLPIVAALSCLAAAAALPAAETLAPPTVPADLQVPAGHALLLRAFAKGAQVYECAAKAAPASGFEWKLTGPDATLADSAGKPLGKHFAGPSWQATDGSTVVGEAAAKAASPTAGAVPWLLLKAKSHSGSGTLADAAFIQRVDTVGGAAPADGCDEAHARQSLRVPYTATYYFYR